MNDLPDSLHKNLRSLKRFEPRADALRSLKERVMHATKTEAPQPFFSRVYAFSQASLFVGGLTMVLMLTLANQLPQYGAYQDSIAALAAAQESAEVFESEDVSLEAIGEVRAATEAARQDLNSLKLSGQLFTYSKEQCFQAYMLFDGYLDYLASETQHVHDKTTDPELKAAYLELGAYIASVQEEAQGRIDLYPDMTQE